MTLKLYAHPFSSYCQKALIAFEENGLPFELAMLETGSAASAECSRLWPTNASPQNCEIEAEKARQRAGERFGVA